MAKWKVAGHIALAMKEAEKLAEQKRILEEQFQESIRNGKVLRKIARERAVFSCKARHPVVKEDRMMSVLNAETEEVERDAGVARSNFYKREDDLTQANLLDTIQSKDASLEEVKRVRKTMDMVKLKDKELDKEIRETREKLRVFNRQIDMVHVVGPEKVERRQEVLHQNYGRQLEENRRLVHHISRLQGQRDHVTQIRQELEKDSETLSKELMEYSEEAKTTYENRDLNRLNISKLKDHLEKSTTAYESDMQLMQFKIDVLRRMECFMTIKNRFRADQGRERRREIRSQVTMTEKDSMHFAHVLEKVCKGLGQDDVRKIVATFNELQEENYMLFRNITETREAIHSMTLQKDQVKEKIACLLVAKQHSDQEAFTRRVELVDKAEMCRKEADKKEEHIAKADQVISIYIQGILAMLNKLDYTEEHIKQIAGIFECVEEQNVQDFLAELEHYINRIYDLRTLSDFLVYIEARKSARMPPPPEPQPPRLALVQRVVVVPPLYEENDDAEDYSLPTEAAFRPLDLTEISHHVDEDLENRERKEELGTHVPSPTMMDATSEAIGDTPQSPLQHRTSIDIF